MDLDFIVLNLNFCCTDFGGAETQSESRFRTKMFICEFIGEYSLASDVGSNFIISNCESPSNGLNLTNLLSEQGDCRVSVQGSELQATGGIRVRHRRLHPSYRDSIVSFGSPRC